MRKAALITAVATVVFGLAGVAYAAITTATFTASISPGPPTRAGTPTAPKPVTFRSSARIQNDDGSQPGQVDKIILRLDRNIDQNSALFRRAGCTTARLNTTRNFNDPACAGNRIGTALATAQVGTGQIFFRTALYGNGRNSIIVFVRQCTSRTCTSFGGTNRAFTAQIIRSSRPFGWSLVIDVPRDLEVIGGSVYPSLIELNSVVIGATKLVRRRVGTTFRLVRVGFFQSEGCTAGNYRLAVQFDLQPTPTIPNPGPDLTVNRTSACRR
jgi:hypothetical protein